MSPAVRTMTAMGAPIRTPTGHVFRVDPADGAGMRSTGSRMAARSKRSSVRPGAQRGRPPAGYFTKRTAEAWLRDTLDAARRGTLAGAIATGATFADAAAEWLRYVEHDRAVKPSTLRDYRSISRRAAAGLGDATSRGHHHPYDRDGGCAGLATSVDRPLGNRSRNKALTILGGILERARRVYKLPPTQRETSRSFGSATTRRHSISTRPRRSGRSTVPQPPSRTLASFLTAAFTGLRRGELVALRWRDVDFERSAIRVAGSVAAGTLTTPKSGHGRVIPMVPEVAQELAKLSKRDGFTSDDDLVFPGDSGGHLDGRLSAGASSQRRSVRASGGFASTTCGIHLERLPSGAQSIVELQSWLGHAEVRTTMGHVPRFGVGAVRTERGSGHRGAQDRRTC